MTNSIISRKTLIYLVIFLSICTVGLVFVLTRTDSLIMHDHSQQLLPQVQVDRISKLRIRTNEVTLTFYKDSEGWKIEEKYGYPVLPERMQEVLGALVELRIIEPKTTNAEYYKLLGVNPITDPGAAGIEITIWDDQNQEQAQFILGKREESKIFVRRPNEIQTWLVQGYVDCSVELRDWVLQPLLGLAEQDSISRVTIVQPTGQELSIVKANINNEDFSLVAVQADKNIGLDFDAINSLPYAISEIEYTDVIPAAALSLDWDKALKVKLETFDQKSMSLAVVRNDGQVIAKVDSRPGWYYKVADHTYALLAVANEDFIIHNPHARN